MNDFDVIKECLNIHCDWCAASPGQPCRDFGGLAPEPHVCRVAPIADAYGAGFTEGQREAREPQEPFCTDHKPVQHRDGCSPWCNACGLDAGGNAPESVFKNRGAK